MDSVSNGYHVNRNPWRLSEVLIFSLYAVIVFVSSFLIWPTEAQEVKSSAEDPGIELPVVDDSDSAATEPWVVRKLTNNDYQYILTEGFNCPVNLTVDGLYLLPDHTDECKVSLVYGWVSPHKAIRRNLSHQVELAKLTGDAVEQERLEALMIVYAAREPYQVKAGTRCGEFRNGDTGYASRVMSVVTEAGVHGWAHCEKFVRGGGKDGPIGREGTRISSTF